MASETTVLPRPKVVSIGTVKEALDFCDLQDRKPDLSDEMRKATQMIRAMSRIFHPQDLLRI
jgi:hypothetical protein